MLIKLNIYAIPNFLILAGIMIIIIVIADIHQKRLCFPYHC